MQTSYTLSKGTQYDKGGVLVLVYGSMLHTHLRADGSFAGGSPLAVSHRAAVEAAAQRVASSGVAETVICGKPEAPEAMLPPASTCPRCGTYCYGDCTA